MTTRREISGDINWLRKAFPKAFKDLPEPYQNDNVLLFWKYEDRIFARPINPDDTGLPQDAIWLWNRLSHEWVDY